MTRSGHSVNRDLGAALKRAAQRTGEQTPSVRGSDWAGAVVTAVNADGTVDAGDLEDVRCMETYIQPAVGDLIYITQSSSGNWLAWGRAATSDDPVGGIRVARKTTDTPRTSTATTAGDPQLLFTVRAGAVYLLDGWIKYTADPAADINVDWDIPAGSLGEWTGAGASIDTAAAANGYQVQLAANDVESARSFGGAGTTANLTLDIKGTLRVGATAGTYQLLWAQRVSNAAATTVYADSWLRLHRVA